MWTLARRILLHDRVKFLVAAAGVSASVLLVLVQVGLYLGFMQNASILIDRARADLWATAEGNEEFDSPAPFDERLYYRIAATPGVAHAERMLLVWSEWKARAGGSQTVQVLGLERGARLLAPWNVVAGDARMLADVEGVVVDRAEFAKLRLTRGLGERAEIFGVRSRVVGVTEGIRSFTTSPFVFTSLGAARAFARLPPERVSYVLVGLEAGADPQAVKRRLEGIPGVRAFTKGELSARTRHFWSSRTGVGAGFLTNAILGVLVGLVVVGQILYSGTLQHLKEYGTLKAMGATARAVVGVILCQAMLSAVVGYAAGGALAFATRALLARANLSVVLAPSLLGGAAVLTAAMCATGSILSILKVLRLDPASVFKA